MIETSRSDAGSSIGAVRLFSPVHPRYVLRMPSSRRRSGATLPLAACLCIAISLPACADLTFERKTETSGTFTSTGWALTLFAVDIPKGALQIARENASDANLANTVVEEVKVTPYLGRWFDWILDIVGVRYARVSGTWGFSGQ
jgi:hypothetical protein